MNSALWVNQARRAAGLSQRELSRRSGVAQSAVARIERGRQVPRADTLERLLAACGFELRLGPVRGGGVDRSLTTRWLKLSPAERAEGAAAYGRAAEVLRTARPLRTAQLFDPLRVLRVFRDHDVQHVVIGGYAAAILGTQIMTADLDLCYERTTKNMERLAAALRELHAKLRVAGVDEDLPFVLDHLSPAAGDSFTFTTDAGDLDVLGTPSGSGGFRDLDADATTYELGDGLLVRVVSLDDLIRMKEAAGRPKDQAHLHVLSDLRAALRDADRPPNT